MSISNIYLQDAYIIAPDKYGDERGFFSETFSKKTLLECGFTKEFIQDNHAYSEAVGVLRGLHFQAPPFAQDKLVRVSRGEILDVLVDLRLGSPTYGESASIILSAENWKQLLVPAGFAHGYVTRQPDTEVIYKVTNYYEPTADCGILWNDRDLDIDWQLDGVVPILSDKDRDQPTLEGFESPFIYQT